MELSLPENAIGTDVGTDVLRFTANYEKMFIKLWEYRQT